MARFERNEKDKLLYHIGDMVMGMHSGIGANFFVAGKIIGTKQPASVFESNSYEVELIDELITAGEMVKGTTLSLNEKEIAMFDKERCLKAIEHWRNDLRLRGEAYQEYLKMIRELYPEKYKKENKV